MQGVDKDSRRVEPRECRLTGGAPPSAEAQCAVLEALRCGQRAVEDMPQAGDDGSWRRWQRGAGAAAGGPMGGVEEVMR